LWAAIVGGGLREEVMPENRVDDRMTLA
jgi:hypothetical protein